MIEAVDRLPAGTSGAEIEEIHFSYSRIEQPWFSRCIIRLVERLSGQRRLESLYRAWAASPLPGENIFSAAVRLMRIGIDTDQAAWDKIPREGPVLFVANHPFGVVDGLLIGHLANRIRPDVKIMTHSLLCQPPEIREYSLPVDFGRTPRAQATSLLTRRRAMDWLASGHALAVFPGGGVATAQAPFTGRALEQVWHPFVGKLARLPGLTIVPVWFEGQNSRLFQLMSHTHYALRIALLFRETARRIGSQIHVRAGEPVASTELANLGGRDAVTRELRRRTLALAGAAGPPPDLAFRWPAHIDAD